MRSLLAITAAAMLASAPAYADHFQIDKSHTNILFHINHLGFSDMIGLMTAYDGGFEFNPDKPEESAIDITIDPKGIRTSSAKLDEVLQGEKWFNTAKYPSIHYVSTGVKVTGKNTGDVTGNMTMLGVTKPVTLHVTFNKGDYHPMTNFYTAGFSATASLKRSDFGMNSYIPLVGDEVRIEIQTEASDLERKKADALKH